MRRGLILRLVVTLALVLGPLHPWAAFAHARGSAPPVEICAAGLDAAHAAGDQAPAPDLSRPCLDCIVAAAALPALPAPVPAMAPRKARRLGRAPRRRPPPLRRVRRHAARDPPADSARS